MSAAPILDTQGIHCIGMLEQKLHPADIAERQASHIVAGAQQLDNPTGCGQLNVISMGTDEKVLAQNGTSLVFSSRGNTL